MRMLDYCINKSCSTIVFMGEQYLESSVPLKIEGIFESYNNDYIVIKRKHCKSYISTKALLVLNVDLQSVQIIVLRLFFSQHQLGFTKANS